MSAEQNKKHPYLGIDNNRVIAAFLKLFREAKANPDISTEQSVQIIQQELLEPTLKIGPEEMAELHQTLNQQNPADSTLDGVEPLQVA